MFQENIFHLTQALPTPVLVLDTAAVRANVTHIRQALPATELFYAVKCNPDRRLLEAINEAGAGFEIASLSEAQAVLALGVSPERIMCLHPVKAPNFVRYLDQRGINVLAADSTHELDKIAELAPGSRIVLRITVPNQGSIVPLNRKFGVEPSAVIQLFQHARARGLRPFGLTIHVGSQCESLETWRAALTICQQVSAEAWQHGFPIQLISLGGGLPAPYTPGSLTLNAISAQVQAVLPNLLSEPSCTISVEPGRAVAASAGVMIATVIGLAERPDGHWAYLDAGVYHGLFEAARIGGGQIPYPVEVQHPNRSTRIYNLAGPTCDSFDLPFERLSLPELHLGDRVAVRCAGAYSTALSSTFNGFPVPAVQYLDDLKQGVQK